MSAPIGDAEDFRLWLADGPFATEYRLDWSGRMFVTGFELDGVDAWEPVGCTSHALADIKQIHELTGAVIARLEGQS